MPCSINTVVVSVGKGALREGAAGQALQKVSAVREMKRTHCLTSCTMLWSCSSETMTGARVELYIGLLWD